VTDSHDGMKVVVVASQNNLWKK